jgi:ABC-type antimicrobial peptide transport system permease subunit
VLLSADQEFMPRPGIVVEAAAGRPEALIEPLRTMVSQVDPRVAITGASTVATELGELTAPIRVTAVVVTVLGLSGLVVALLGLYGVIAYAVRSRTREMAVRMALGARPGQVRRLVMGQSLTMVLSGVLPGIVLAALSVGLIRSLLFEVGPYDPLTFTLIPAALITAGLWATYPPARRATRVNPTDALREL